MSDYIYELFMKYIDEIRLSMRHSECVEESNYSIGINKLKKNINEKKKKLEEEGTSFSYSDTEIDTLVNLLDKCENNFYYIMQREQYLVNELNVQKEETDIAWWLLNEWSQSCNCPGSMDCIDKSTCQSRRSRLWCKIRIAEILEADVPV